MINLSREILFTSAAVACAAVASVQDVRERRIPNLLTGWAIVLALAFHLFTGGWTELATSACAGLLAGGILLLFFIAGGLGAGDVKLMAAIGCFTGLRMLPTVLFATALCGALLGVVLAITRKQLRETIANTIALVRHHRDRGLIPHPELNIDNASVLCMPFALPIAAGCLITAGVQIWSS